MKKTFILSLVVAFTLLSVNVVLAKVNRVAGEWVIEGEQGIVFTCGGGEYAHTLTDGFPGSGTYDANESYTWNMTGSIEGDAIAFTVVYTGVNAGYTLSGAGTIATDGSISGTVDGNCQTFTMDAGTATQEVYKNHGQYVRLQEEKKAAAQSRIGMPVQSKGHTK